MCDGGQDYIDKQYSFIAQLSDVTSTQMKKGERERKEGRKEEREEKMYSTDTQLNCASTSQSFFLQVPNSTNVRGWDTRGQHGDDDCSTRLLNSSS